MQIWTLLVSSQGLLTFTLCLLSWFEKSLGY